jgi:hypothetical protein
LAIPHLCRSLPWANHTQAGHLDRLSFAQLAHEFRDRSIHEVRRRGLAQLGVLGQTPRDRIFFHCIAFIAPQV